MSVVARLRELSGKATKGFWFHSPLRVKSVDMHGVYDQPIPSGEFDSELIATMRNNIDRLLNVVEAAKRAREVLILEYNHRMFEVNFKYLHDALAALDESPESKGEK